MAIALDFDGVLNTYTKYLGDDELFEPAKGVERFLNKLQELKQPIIIHTARRSDKVQAWLDKYELSQYIHTVTNQKVPAIVYVDDRGLQFQGDFKQTLKEIAEFKVWYKPGCPFEDWKNDETIYGTLEQRGLLNGSKRS